MTIHHIIAKHRDGMWRPHKAKYEYAAAVHEAAQVEHRGLEVRIIEEEISDRLIQTLADINGDIGIEAAIIAELERQPKRKENIHYLSGALSNHGYSRNLSVDRIRAVAGKMADGGRAVIETEEGTGWTVIALPPERTAADISGNKLGG